MYDTICGLVVSPEVQGAVAHPVCEGGGDGGSPVPPVPHLPLWLVAPDVSEVMLGPRPGHHDHAGLTSLVSYHI